MKNKEDSRAVSPRSSAQLSWYAFNQTGGKKKEILVDMQLLINKHTSICLESNSRTVLQF